MRPEGLNQLGAVPASFAICREKIPRSDVLRTLTNIIIFLSKANIRTSIDAQMKISAFNAKKAV